MIHTETVLVRLMIAGLDLSISTTIAWTLLGTAVLVAALVLTTRRVSIRPDGAGQVLVEYVAEFVERQMLAPTGLDPARWTPLILSLFLYILVNNLAGIVPGGMASTSNINQTGALAILVFVVSYFQMFRHRGVSGFVRSLVPEGVRGPVLVILMPVEFVSQLLRPFSLAVRLFANMSGGHLLLLTIIGFTAVFANAVVDVLAVGGTVFVFLFEIFVAFIQAYVFAFLSALMISQSLEEEH
jgi:F-type H+-transporting ATPase subunit a